MPVGRPVLRLDVDDFVLRTVVLFAVLLLATAIGLLLRRQAGRAREVTSGDLLEAADLAAPLGERATFVQFSSPTCSPCRSVRQVLAAVVAADPGLGHVEIDATERLALARRLSILRTPTVLLLDSRGLVIRRISGPITAEQARAAVPEALRSRS
jgi:thiol-disulfide isomerase/thioredoxin